MSLVIESTEKTQIDRNFSLVNPLEYFNVLTLGLQDAKMRVMLKTMNFEADHFSLLLFHKMEEAAGRGIDVQFHSDYFAHLVTDGQIDYISSLGSSERQYRGFRRSSKAKVLEAIRESEVKVLVTNPPEDIFSQFLPATGRNHIKVGIIDNVAYLGGINLTDKDFARTDLMVAITDPVLVNALASLFSNEKPQDDYCVISGDTRLLVDAGQRGKSIIVEGALDAIKHAKHSIRLTSQFTPDGRIPQALAEACQRGVDVKVIVSDPNSISERIPLLFDRLNAAALKILRIKFPTYEYPSWVHIKGLLIDEDTDNARIIIGTHNFSGKGVDLGNQEASLDSSNTSLIANFSMIFSSLMSKAEYRS